MTPQAVQVIVTFLVMSAVGMGLLIWVLSPPAKRAPPTDPPGVRTCVTFSGGEAHATAEEAADETASGEGLLRALGERLALGGVEVGTPLAEEGYASVEVSGHGQRLYVFAGRVEAHWLVSISSGAGRVLGHGPVADSPLLRTLLPTLHGALGSLPGIEAVTWHRAEDWHSGHPERGAAEPLLKTPGAS